MPKYSLLEPWLWPRLLSSSARESELTWSNTGTKTKKPADPDNRAEPAIPKLASATTKANMMDNMMRTRVVHDLLVKPSEELGDHAFDYSPQGHDTTYAEEDAKIAVRQAQEDEKTVKYFDDEVSDTEPVTSSAPDTPVTGKTLKRTLTVTDLSQKGMSLDPQRAEKKP
ncbi:hypothetical protein BS47DRAFT_1361571 [Hydnum rufescens UP504]|uniref:Uncharacterized protein n=1 Tax=Hydnum rufescens UP504 TaxID=1448309 RepID=A0A9P6DUX9_9AGAM|nr:hypothetical protein BS47DRAFT_1361571 [Hydnum rufescens UP504]